MCKTLKDTKRHYCSGCGHNIAHKIIAEVIDEMGIRGRCIATAPVGCAVLLYNYINCDIIECAHGRSPAAATAIKRLRPDNVVFTYQGDGDLAAIGTSETIHAANRGENFTIIFINNAIYGMTGGQMAPTTITGQKSTTSPKGRGSNQEGPPIKVCELLDGLDGPTFLQRCALGSSGDVADAKEAVRKAFEIQLAGKGFSLVEMLSMCPTDWKKSPKEAVKYVNEELKKVFPVGVIRDRS
jgi:2-oxoglutarate ferredoxin oxidoreductase subunit beta